MAYAVALGRPFFGQKTKRGGVLYVAAEGGGTIAHRMMATRAMMEPMEIEEDCFDRPPEQPLPIVTIKDDVPDLAKPAGLQQLIATAVMVNNEMKSWFGVSLHLVIIDTALAAFSIDDWNSPSDVTKITTAMNKIRTETGASVISVAHHGKDVTKGISGSFASKANADTILSVIKIDDDNVLSGRVKERTVLLTKFRDGEAGFQHGFEIESYYVGKDDDDEAVYPAASG